MTWVDRDAIVQGTLAMLRVNMGIQPGERLLILADVPTSRQWESSTPGDVEVMLRRAYLARLVAEVARERLTDCVVEFRTYPSTGRNAVEPPEAAASWMRSADVALLITSFSLTHTDAREAASRRGTRVASMPRFLPEMLYPDGPMAVDYRAVAAATQALARLITGASRVRISTPAGTDVEFSVEGREGRSDDGLYTTPGAWGNLPAGEAYCAPLEGTARGRIVVEPGWHARLASPMTVVLDDGEVVTVEGGGDVGDEIAEILDLAARSPAARPRRMFGELGIGTNPNARRTDITVEAEKIRGTVHLAIGDNSHMGGVVVADFHQDFVLPRPDMWFDGEPIIIGGRWVARPIAAA